MAELDLDELDAAGCGSWEESFEVRAMLIAEVRSLRAKVGRLKGDLELQELRAKNARHDRVDSHRIPRTREIRSTDP